ncbi:hypothetical protein [Acidaminococcus timonensis]|jgi:hypothetical protein|uniref:hypothetical protein n=1 Tax=Acidaminococcus timonensis TaxID=1871002 RepID=UPI003A5C3C57
MNCGENAGKGKKSLRIDKITCFLYDIKRKDDRNDRKTKGRCGEFSAHFSILGKGSGWEAQRVRLIDFMRGTTNGLEA